MNTQPKRITIVGGGYTACAITAQLSAAATEKLDITIIEPREMLGAGLTYSAPDPDHRVNAPTAVHFLFPERPDHLRQWFLETGGLERDPEAQEADGVIYPRRTDFGDYLVAMMEDLKNDNPSGSIIRHLRDRATAMSKSADGFEVSTEAGETLASDLVFVATGNLKSTSPPPFDGEINAHPRFIPDPWDLARLKPIEKDQRILIMGTGLTTVDIVATLVREGHAGQILAISRRGLRSRALGLPPPGRRPVTPFERIEAPVPNFLPPPGDPSGVMGVLRALRARIREVEAEGGGWRGPFDELRDSVWQIWPAFSNAQKRIFLRRLKIFYDMHRFRLPPQSGRVMDQAIERGLVTIRAARAVSVEAEGAALRVGIRGRGGDLARTEIFDWVIDCTGLEASPEKSGNPFLLSLLNQGFARLHPVGIGFDVDDECRALGTDDQANEALFIVGPPTAGAFGAPIGATFIAFQVSRIVPSILAALGLDTAG